MIVEAAAVTVTVTAEGHSSEPVSELEEPLLDPLLLLLLLLTASAD